MARKYKPRSNAMVFGHLKKRYFLFCGPWERPTLHHLSMVAQCSCQNPRSRNIIHCLPWSPKARIRNILCSHSYVGQRAAEPGHWRPAIHRTPGCKATRSTRLACGSAAGAGRLWERKTPWSTHMQAPRGRASGKHLRIETERISRTVVALFKIYEFTILWRVRIYFAGTYITCYVVCSHSSVGGQAYVCHG